MTLTWDAEGRAADQTTSNTVNFVMPGASLGQEGARELVPL